jgi:hypothetical protein
MGVSLLVLGGSVYTSSTAARYISALLASVFQLHILPRPTSSLEL